MVHSFVPAGDARWVMDSYGGPVCFDTEIWIFRDISSVTVGMVFVVENSRPVGLETLL